MGLLIDKIPGGFFYQNKLLKYQCILLYTRGFFCAAGLYGIFSMAEYTIVAVTNSMTSSFELHEC